VVAGDPCEAIGSGGRLADLAVGHPGAVPRSSPGEFGETTGLEPGPVGAENGVDALRQSVPDVAVGVDGTPLETERTPCVDRLAPRQSDPAGRRVGRPAPTPATQHADDRARDQCEHDEEGDDARP
jgi:hypothetical protein